MARNLRHALGKEIRRRRQQRGLSQEAFADQVGLHRTYIGSIERGERNVSLENLSRLAEALGIRVSTLRESAEGREVRDG